MNNCFFLNLQCGADFVKIRQAVPHGMPTIEPYTRCVSIDGDADRIIYFFTDENNQFFLLDGDRIATLYAGYVTTPILALLICNKNNFFLQIFNGFGNQSWYQIEIGHRSNCLCQWRINRLHSTRACKFCQIFSCKYSVQFQYIDDF